MTKEEIRKMEAGSEIDALFAELVMGWHIEGKEHCRPVDWWIPNGWGKTVFIQHGGYNVNDFNPSTNISHAWEGVEKYANDNHVLELMWIPRYTEQQKGFWSFMIRENFMKGIKDALFEKDEEIPLRQQSGIADTKELAITRALILWAMEKKNDKK